MQKQSWRLQKNKQALDKAKKRNGAYDYFSILGIPLGTILTYSKDHTITCEVLDNRKVRFRDKVTSLSASALIIANEMGYDWTKINGAAYWCYNKKSLVELRFEHD